MHLQCQGQLQSCRGRHYLREACHSTQCWDHLDHWCHSGEDRHRRSQLRRCNRKIQEICWMHCRYRKLPNCFIRRLDCQFLAQAWLNQDLSQCRRNFRKVLQHSRVVLWDSKCSSHHWHWKFTKAEWTWCYSDASEIETRLPVSRSRPQQNAKSNQDTPRSWAFSKKRVDRRRS